jgi:hypothetical protein
MRERGREKRREKREIQTSSKYRAVGGVFSLAQQWDNEGTRGLSDDVVVNKSNYNISGQIELPVPRGIFFSFFYFFSGYKTPGPGNFGPSKNSTRILYGPLKRTFWASKQNTSFFFNYFLPTSEQSRPLIIQADFPITQSARNISFSCAQKHLYTSYLPANQKREAHILTTLMESVK